MANMLTGLFAGNWSDDPALNARGQMGALGAASALLDTHGKTGGQLLSGAVQGWMGGNQQERITQLKERDVNSDIDYKRSLMARSQQEFADKIHQMGLSIHKAKTESWSQAAIAASLGQGPDPGPRPDLGASFQDAAGYWKQFSTSGSGARMGAASGPQAAPGGGFSPSGASPPQPPMLAPPGGGMGPPAGMQQPPPGAALFDPNTRTGLAEPPSNGTGFANGATGTAGPDNRLPTARSVKAWDRNMAAGAPGMQQPAMQPQQQPMPMPQQQPMPQGAGQQPGTEAQQRLATLTNSVKQRMLQYNLPPSKEEMAAISFLTGEVQKGSMIGANGVVMPQPGSLEATQAGAKATAYGQKAPDLVTILNGDGSETQVPHEAFIAAQKAGIPMRTKLSPQEVATQQSNPNLRITPPASPDQPPQFMTDEQIRARAAGGGVPGTGGVPGAPGAGGMPAGMTPNDESWRKQQGDRRTANWETFDSAFKESEDKRGKAATTIQNMEGARSMLPPSTGKWDEFAQPWKAWISSLVGMSPEQTEQVYKAEGFTGLMNRALVATQGDFKGSVSNVEYTTAQKTIANLGNTRQANEFLLDFQEYSAKKQLWMSEQVASLNDEANAALNNKQPFDLMARLNELQREAYSPERSIFNAPAMQRWKGK